MRILQNKGPTGPVHEFRNDDPNLSFGNLTIVGLVQPPSWMVLQSNLTRGKDKATEAKVLRMHA